MNAQIYESAKEYILALPYNTWISIADIKYLSYASCIIDMIDESWLCQFYYNDEGTAFKKRRFTKSYLQ